MARTHWKPAKKVPKHWEQQEAWRWNEYDAFRPFIEVIPKDFSREPHHCKGIWYRLLEVPLPPVHRNR